jgi:hypothetical protein
MTPEPERQATPSEEMPLEPYRPDEFPDYHVVASSRFLPFQNELMIAPPAVYEAQTRESVLFPRSVCAVTSGAFPDGISITRASLLSF